MFAGRSAARTWSGVRKPRAVLTGRIWRLPTTAAPATSLLKMWESRSRTTSWPVCVWLTTAMRLPIVPEATKRPAALPSRSAASASSRLTVGSSSQTSSPTWARAMASRISGVGRVSVSERRSTMSCTGLSLVAGDAGADEPLLATAAPFGEVVVDGQSPEPVDRLGVLALVGVHLGEQIQRLRDDGGARIVLQHQLEPLPRRARIALSEVVVGDPHFLLGDSLAALVDLGEPVGRVPALRVFLHELLELVERLLGQRLVLLDGLHLVVVAHGQPILDQVRDLVPGEERQEPLELFHRLVELGLAIEGLADVEPRFRRVRRVRVALDDLPEILPRLVVPAITQLGFTGLVELIWRQDRRRRRRERCAAGHEQRQGQREDTYKQGGIP